MTTKLFLSMAALTTAAFALAAREDIIPPEQRMFFEFKIEPVLAEKCYSCHSAKAEKPQADLLLDTREGTLRGGTHGPAVVPGDLMASILISAVRWHDDDKGMPPESKGGRLPDEVIADFERWILLGAPDPRETPPKKEAE